MRCAVVGCDSDNQSKRNPCKDIKFFSFPKDANLSKKWLHLTKREDKVNVKNAVICSKHFCESDYKINLKHILLGYTPKNYRGLKDDAIPTQNLPQSQCFPLHEPSTSGTKRKRENVVEKRQRAQLIKDIMGKAEMGEDITEPRLEPEIADIREGQNLDHNVVVVPSTTSEIGVQTNENMVDLERRLLDITRENEKLKYQLDGVKKVFSENQIKKMNSQKRIKWSVSEISSAISMYAAGPRAYRLSLKKGFPYPAVSTLKEWLRKIKLEPGILKNVLKMAEFADMTEKDRVCTIVFDEMKIRKEYQYDPAKDSVIKPYDYVQVAMIKGIFKSWKQPIFYNFDCKMTSAILMDIIKFVEDSGFHVVAMVSDLGGANRGLHSELNISEAKPYFENPSTKEKIFVFADVPHLLKLIRNNFVDHGFLIENKVIKKQIVEEAINASSGSDLKITHSITLDQLNVAGPQRQKVKYAAKLFSHTMSRAISRCGTLGFLTTENWLECADFFKLVNDWFDVFNVSIPVTDSRARNKAYGLALEEQNTILNKMSEVITQLKVVSSRSTLPFQKGILLSNSALKMLREDLDRRFGAKYLLTRRINQDVIENFFGVIRAKGGLHDHPSPLEFKYRLRSFILGKNEGAYSDYSNVELDDTPDIPLSGTLVKKLNITFELSAVCDDGNTDLNELNELEYDGLENLAGFVCHKLQDPTLQSSSSQSFSWTDHLSEGGLSKPSSVFLSQIKGLNKVFLQVNGDGLITGKQHFIKDLLEKSSHIDCPIKAKRLFFRSRMFFRIKELNKNLKEKSNLKRKWKKVVS